MLKRITGLLVVALLVAAQGYAQTTTSTTTLSSAITSTSNTTVVVASATGITAGSTALYVDRELMLVTGVSGTNIKVIRGYAPTSATTHLSGSVVYLGPIGNGPFIGYDKTGSCTSTNETYLPQINPATGKRFNCNASTWTVVNDGIASSRNLISGLGATATLLSSQCGSTVLLDRAAGIVVTLPAPSVGCFFDFVVTTSVTSSAYKFSTATQGTDFIVGTYIDIDTDTSNATLGMSCNGSTHDNFSMNGTTTGGLIGSHFRLTAVTSTLWLVEGVQEGSGAVATSCATS